MKKEVTFAHLHAPMFIPNAGNYKETLTADPTGPDRGMKMFLEDGAQYLEVQTKGVLVAIPLSNITHMVFKK